MLPITRNRLAVAAAGAFAGLAGWLLVDVVPDVIAQPRAILALATAGVSFFFVVLVSLGPLPPPKAAQAGAIVGLPATALMTLASYRFDEVEPFLETMHPVLALAVLVALPVPYLIAGLGTGRRWLDYALLFDTAWAAFVRGVAALFFVLVAWGVIWLSDTVLKIVGLTIIEDVLGLAPVPWLVTGLLLGLALAVANELSQFVSPHLPLRLLRLLAPAVLAVVALFLAVLPFRGLSDLFGNLSAAGTLMAMGLTVLTLASAALDRDDEAAAGGLIRRATAGLALLLPLLAGLAVVAVVERVGQYGWTPDRLAAAILAALLLAYGVLYAVAVLGRHGWMRRIRWANARLALLAVLLAAAWMTPVLDAQRVSAASQIARFESGRISASDLDLWTIGREWGRAGAVAIVRLGALEHPEATTLRERLDHLAAASTRADFEASVTDNTEREIRAAFLAALPVVPDGGRLPPGLLDRWPVQTVSQWVDACGRSTPGGNPGCAAVVGDFIGDVSGDEVILFTLVSDTYVSVTALVGDGRQGAVAGDLAGFSQADAIDRILAGEAGFSSMRLEALRLGGDLIFLLP